MNRILCRGLIFVFVVGLFVLLYSTYSKPVRKVGTTEKYGVDPAEGEDLTDFVEGGFPVLQESGRTLWADLGGVLWLTDDASGETLWRNTADEGDAYLEGTEASALSPVSLQYQFAGEQAVDMYSAEDVEEGNCQIAYSPDGSRLRVTYLFGETGADGILPLGLTVSYMEETVLPAISESDRDYLMRRYELVTPDKASSSVLESCPGIKDGPLYYLADCKQVTKQRKTIDILKKAGITEEQYQAQCLVTGEVQPTMAETYRIAVEYWLENGDLMMNIPCGEIRFHPDNPLTLIRLNGYATYADNQEEGYYLLPAGSGALQEFRSDLERSNTYRFLGETRVEKELIPFAGSSFPLPVFGVSRADGTGLLVAIEEGAALAQLQEKFTNSASMLSLAFQILEYGDASITHGNASTMFGYGTYQGDIRLRYRFLRSESDYGAMAKAYRELLVSQELLPKTPRVTASCLIEFVGNVRRSVQWQNVVPTTANVPLTTYAQTEQILRRLEEAGVEQMAVKLSGYNEGGLYCQVPGDYRWADTLGRQAQRLALLDYLKENEIPAFLDVNLAFFYQQKNAILSGYNAQTQSAKTLNNAPAEWDIVNDSNSKNSVRAGTLHVVAPAKYASFAQSYLKTVDAGLGVSLGDSLTKLTVDFNARAYSDRAETFDKMRQALSILSGERLVLAKNPSADALSDLAMAESTSAFPNLAVDYTNLVPFVQMVLHGHVAYASPPLNAAADARKAFLQAVETGCVPQYAIAARFDSAMSETEYGYLYYLDCEEWLDTIASDVTRARKELGDLADVEMLSRREEGDVAIVEYANGAVVCVNYGAEDATVNQINVPARDFARIH